MADDLRAVAESMITTYRAIPLNAPRGFEQSMVTLAKAYLSLTGPALEFAVRQAIIDWNRKHIEPGRPFPPLDIDQHKEGELADAVLAAIRSLNG